MEYKKTLGKRFVRIIGILLIVFIIGYYLYLLKKGQVQMLLEPIRNLGFIGILLGIVVQSAVNIVPVPGQFISIILMEVYGPVWGGFFSWIGGITGALGALYLTKWIGKSFFGKMAEPYIQKVDTFMKRRETLGLLLVRFVPFVPYHFVNYAAGLLNVSIPKFIWTTAIGVLPYNLVLVGLYGGIRTGSLIWGFAGAVILVLLAGFGVYLKKKEAAN